MLCEAPGLTSGGFADNNMLAEDGSELSFDFGMMDHPGQLNNLRLAEMRRGEKPIVAAPLTCADDAGACSERLF